MNNTQAVRARYARMVVAKAGSDDQALVRAFSAVPREHFVGTGAWQVETSAGLFSVPTDDPTDLYQDTLVALSAERGINNGQPSLHAHCLAAVRVARGDAVVQVGAGTGYYTAILAELVGPTGLVHAYEIESDLAELASSNLAAWPNVEVHAASACDRPLPLADVIYVNAGATHPLESWLDALTPAGRLLFPLTADDGIGGTLLVMRVGELRYTARFTSGAAFIPCQGARRERDAKAVAAAFQKGGASTVKSLWRNANPDHTAWCVGIDWWLSTAALNRAADRADQRVRYRICSVTGQKERLPMSTNQPVDPNDMSPADDAAMASLGDEGDVCPECEGHGILKDKTECTNCGGTGRIAQAVGGA